jgi:hypothetical protein
MSVGEWLTFVEHLGLVEMGQLSTLNAKLIFVWSRIRTLPAGKEKSKRAESKMRHLFPSDFFEALVRMSTMVALPTDEEIEEAGAADAGEFLLTMRRRSPAEYTLFLRTHRPKHTRPDGADWDEAKPMQPVEVCLGHLLKLLVRLIEFSTSAAAEGSDAKADGVVQVDEVERFLRLRAKGGALGTRDTMGQGVDFSVAIVNAESKKIMTAAAVCIQMMMRAKKARQNVREARQRAAHAPGHEGIPSPVPEERADGRSPNASLTASPRLAPTGAPMQFDSRLSHLASSRYLPV